MEHTLWYTFVLLVVAVAVGAAGEPSEDYLPRSIGPNEDSMPERPPSEEQPPLSFAASLKPVEFQYLVPLDAPVQSDDQTYRYEVDQSPEEEDTEEEEQQHQLPSRAEIETVLKKYFGSKSKYLYDKDQVGIAGKESRFRRGASRSGASASSSASSSSYSSNGSPVYFGNQPDFGSFGVNQGGLGGFGGGDGGGYGGGYNQGFASNDDDGLHMRFAGEDSDEPIRGVYSGASSSIDSDGKATYSIKAGKF